jgi:hypothetical protein
MTTPVFLAGAFRIGEDNSLRALIPSGSSVGQALIYFGALFLVGLGVFGWAIIFRRQRNRRHTRHAAKPAAKNSPPSGDLPRSRTLAEAGGLPPVRTEK